MVNGRLKTGFFWSNGIEVWDSDLYFWKSIKPKSIKTYDCLLSIGCRAKSAPPDTNDCDITGWSFDRYYCTSNAQSVCEYEL